MKKNDRQDQILELLKNHKTIKVGELADVFKTSELTIRKDLNELNGKNKLHRTYGGATTINTREEPLQERRKKKSNQKSSIGAQAVALIKEGDSIFIDNGTTTERIADTLSGFSRLSVITTGLNIVMALLPHVFVTTYVPEGRIDSRSFSVVGSQAESSLSKYNARIAFIGIDGITIEQGLLNNSYEASATSQIMLKNSQVRVLLADSSKFGNIATISLCPINAIDILITDAGIPSSFQKAFEDAGIKVIIA